MCTVTQITYGTCVWMYVHAVYVYVYVQSHCVQSSLICMKVCTAMCVQLCPALADHDKWRGTRSARSVSFVALPILMAVVWCSIVSMYCCNRQRHSFCMSSPQPSISLLVCRMDIIPNNPTAFISTEMDLFVHTAVAGASSVLCLGSILKWQNWSNC